MHMTAAQTSAERCRRRIAAASLLTLFAVRLAWAATEPLNAPSAGAPAIPDDFVLAAGGDLIGPYRPVLKLNSPGFLELVSILRQADVAFANHEGSLFDLHKFSGGPSAENGGGLPLQSLDVGRELKAMGFKLLSKANNHATDFGVAGLSETEKSLREIGIVFAGSGASLDAARAPAYLQTPKGNVALVATASTFVPMSVAQPSQISEGLMTRPSPGISVIRNESSLNVTREQMGWLAQIASVHGLLKEMNAVAVPARLQLGQQSFAISENPGLTYDANSDDQEGVLASIREARKKAPLVIFSIHAHETASLNGDDPHPAAFLRPLFHKAIDAGAGAIVRHGPHLLNGIEIYNGKPIFYGMGSLFFDFGGARSYTIPNTNIRLDFPDTWFETAVVTTQYRAGRVHEIRIYPALIEVSTKPTVGLPNLARGADAERILERLKRDSQQFGTDIQIVNGVGIIHGSPAR